MDQDQVNNVEFVTEALRWIRGPGKGEIKELGPGTEVE